MAELNVNIAQLQLKNPVMTASGTFGYGLEFADSREQHSNHVRATTILVWQRQHGECSTA